MSAPKHHIATRLSALAVLNAIGEWPGLYERPDGYRFMGMPVSEVPKQLLACGWRNVSRLDEHDFEAMGLAIVDARYVGGRRPKRFCRVIVSGAAAPRYIVKRRDEDGNWYHAGANCWTTERKEALRYATLAEAENAATAFNDQPKDPDYISGKAKAIEQ